MVKGGVGLPRNAQETTFGTAFEGIEGAFLGCALNATMGDGLWIMGDGVILRLWNIDHATCPNCTRCVLQNVSQ